LENPRRLQVYAWNIALREARGEYYAMIGAHAVYGSTYFAQCVDAIKRTGAHAVGGVAVAFGEGALGHAIAWCMSSPFGVGNARFRYTDREQEADSVFALFTTRSILESVGGFDESLPFDEDSDLNYRLRQRGYKLVVSPRVPVRYAVRRSLRALWKQMYRYGYWRRFTQRKHGAGVPMRTYVPAAFLGALAAALRSIPATGWKSVLVPPAAATMHVAYGWGWWSAAIANLRAPLRRAARNAAR
jgi:GT2 family glycosyltransferase